MKIRQGFVSNSSSSSFVISINTKGLSVDTIRERLFGYGYSDDIVNDYHGTVSVKRVCEILFHDIQDAMEENASNIEDLPLNEISESYMSNVWSEAMDKFGFDGSWDEKQEYVNEKENDVRKSAGDRLDDWKRRYPDNDIVVIEYGDGDGSLYSYLEHSGIVEKLGDVSVKVSHH